MMVCYQVNDLFYGSLRVRWTFQWYTLKTSLDEYQDNNTIVNVLMEIE